MSGTRVLKVAIIEDQFGIREGLRLLIDGTEGYRCCGSFGSMEEGLAQIARDLPDVVLVDIGLPGMSGYEVARQLRAEPATRGVFIAALTGYGQEADRQRSFAAGFDYHLTKPPNPGVLEAMLVAPRRRTGDAADREDK